MPFIFCSSLLILLHELHLTHNHPIDIIPHLIMNPSHHSHHSHHWSHGMHHAFKHPQIKINLIDTRHPDPHPPRPNPSDMILHLLHSLYRISLILMFLYLSSALPLSVGATTTKPPASMQDIDELINNGNSELCATMSNCEYLTNRIENVTCWANTVCLLICDDESPCTFLDVYTGANSALIIDCVDHKSCDEVWVHGAEAYFVYMEGNDPHSIFHSQVQCPIQSEHDISCIIHGNCIDINGASHCRQEYDTPIISYLSIYSYTGYSDLQLKCDEDDTESKQGAWCFDENNVILCGAQPQSQTCWIEYDTQYKQYICDGDDLARNVSKCSDQMPPNAIASTLTGPAVIETAEAWSASDWMNDLLSRKQYTIYLVAIMCILLCCCCLFGFMLCTYSAHHHQGIKTTNHHKLSFEKENGNSLCCCCYCCYFVWNGLKRRYSSSDHDEDDTGTAVDIEHAPNHTQITATTDGSVIRMNTMENTMHNTTTTKTTNEACADSNTNAHPMNKYIRPLQMQIVESQTGTNTQETPHPSAQETPRPQHQVQPSDSATITGNTTHSSHNLDGNSLEAQAAKKLFDAKLGIGNKRSPSDHHMAVFCHGFDFNPDAFGVAKQTNTDSGVMEMSEDCQLAWKIQQEQLYNAVQGHKTIKSMQQNTQSTSNASGSQTAQGDEKMEDHIHNTSNTAVLDIGGGFKIGMADYSSSPVHGGHETQYSDSSTSSEFDPEYPNHGHAEDEYSE
eukprot:301217_1